LLVKQEMIASIKNLFSSKTPLEKFLMTSKILVDDFSQININIVSHV